MFIWVINILFSLHADGQTQIAEIAEDFGAETEGSQESVNVGMSGECSHQGMWVTNLFTLRLTGSDVQTPNVGDIAIEYHPHSQKDTRILKTEEFKESLSGHSEPTEPLDDKPWCPFRSREDYEFAELVHDATLNRAQIERFIKLLQCCQDFLGSFTLDNYNDLKHSLEDASKLLTPVIIPLPSVVN